MPTFLLSQAPSQRLMGERYSMCTCTIVADGGYEFSGSSVFIAHTSELITQDQRQPSNAASSLCIV